jgi:phosphoglycolate phosphatase
MAFCLKDLLEFDDIVIQCHDNPDADALASGFALKWYLDKYHKKSRFIYGGRAPISKSNLVLMKDNLGIPVEYVTELKPPQLLVTVDCQYGESNVKHFDAENIATIDHHQISATLPAMSALRSNYGSCSTIIYELLQMEDIDINSNVDIATALYYGLMTDTGGFEEISHPSDRDLRDYAKPRMTDIVLFKNSNLSKAELVIAGDALKHAYYDERLLYAIVESKPCDPNILGIISDMTLEVDSIDACLVYSVMPFGVKISVRSCVREIKASELAAFLAAGFGGGGGHLIKAGGLLKKDLLEKAGISYDNASIRSFLDGRLQDYFENSEIIYANNHNEDISTFNRYTKKELSLGYLRATELAEPGTKIMIRTFEGDIDTTIEDDIFIVIGIDGEVYPIKKEKFEENYRLSDAKYEYPGEYAPSVINHVSGERVKILPYAKSCLSKGGCGIYAKKLDHRVKVFTKWDPEKYYLGTEGDYLVIRTDDLSDMYVIANDVFKKTYIKEQ